MYKRQVLDSPNARLGIVTTGKSYLDVLQALEYLGLDEAVCADIGIRVYKVGMTWPLEPRGIEAVSYTHLDVYKRQELGRIAPGYRADLVLLDAEVKVQRSWVGGVE